jgi:hypothetical protein
MDTSWLVNTVVQQVLTPLCEPVHPAWIDGNTTPLATSAVVLELSDGGLVMLAPCEVYLDPDKYPSLGLSLERCDPEALQWVRNGKTYSMRPFAGAAGLLPFSVSKVVESDPLGEGALSEVLLVGPLGQLLFRHIMPPMSLGIEVMQAGQAPNKSFKPMPLRGTA